jgi:ribose 5-phosphate isomerase B
MRVAIGSDHAGHLLKNKIKALLQDLGLEVLDFGTDGETSVDYPDYGIKVAEAISEGRVDRGILICGTGIGMSIVANKYPGVRAALCHDSFTARVSREHNDANVLVLGGRVIDHEKALDMGKVWFSTEFEGGRHNRRLQKIRELEKATMNSKSRKD